MPLSNNCHKGKPFVSKIRVLRKGVEEVEAGLFSSFLLSNEDTLSLFRVSVTTVMLTQIR